ncbi:formate dehydrogenase accessory protein FdhE [Hyphomicrobium sp. CS1GBMeth3]|uniref:formate dehydrogenase accessory protein FdhE n=1 Tax=Hyphomicrobium sp. CS1GBMeth3 TaxID=1892845 RepID=UPI000931182F|nr:formate dehydrogenase accessory protein FdhE [Hyphomicrobium sp. CS1GBMeth3]
MSETKAPKNGLMDIGKEAVPTFVVRPEPALLFDARAKRFRSLAVDHPLAPYLSFLADLTQAQHDIQANLAPVALPDPEDMERALANDMPPLPAPGLALDDTATLTVKRLFERIADLAVPPPTATARDTLLKADADQRKAMAVDALTTPAPPDEIALRVLVLAGLQVHFARLASLLDASRLKRITDGVCPACGSAPVSSSVVGWPKAHNTRFCTCSLCSTMWHVVRVKCVLCSSTEGISYQTIEGSPDTVKAECCDSCQRYVKILYQVKDPALDAMADDVATLGLDMVLAENGWQRGGASPFLQGY